METQIGENMKMIIFLILVSTKMFAATCSSISRTNYSANQILTSSSLNQQLNQAFGAVNSLDAGCLQDGTLEFSAVNATDWATPLRAIQQGCKVSYTSASSVTISKCYASVNGSWVSKSTTTAVSMGCSGCSAEVVSTTYYLYIATGSTGSTITGLISTTVPNDDGHDNSGNKVVARFYNNASSDIDQYSIDQWVVNRFVPTNTGFISYTPTGSWVANTAYLAKFKRSGGVMEIFFEISTSGAPTSATLTASLPAGYLINTTQILDTANLPLGIATILDTGTTVFTDVYTMYATTSTVNFTVGNNFVTQTTPMIWANGDVLRARASFPIAGWND